MDAVDALSNLESNNTPSHSLSIIIVCMQCHQVLTSYNVYHSTYIVYPFTPATHATSLQTDHDPNADPAPELGLGLGCLRQMSGAAKTDAQRGYELLGQRPSGRWQRRKEESKSPEVGCHSRSTGRTNATFIASSPRFTLSGTPTSRLPSSASFCLLQANKRQDTFVCRYEYRKNPLPMFICISTSI